MDNKEVIDLIGAMNDYADKKNNQGLKNVLLITLIGIVSSVVASIIGYGWKEIGSLRTSLDEQKAKVTRIEARYDISLKEQNKIVFGLMEMLAEAEKEKADAETENVENKIKNKQKDIEKKFFPKDEDKFKDFQKHFEQRVQDRLPMEQQIQR